MTKPKASEVFGVPTPAVREALDWIRRSQIAEDLRAEKQKVRCATCDGAKLNHTQRCQAIEDLARKWGVKL